MKCSESWLREWVNPDLTREQIADTLTMAGLEVESLAPAANAFTGVVIGKVLTVNKHPEADKLNVCTVDVGGPETLTIVCGASNVAVNMKAAVAMLGAVLPNKMVIAPASIRKVASEGMLCSASELNLSEDSEGLLVLPEDAPLGQDLWVYLDLADYTIDISITPNRGDCLSVRGVARELSALTHTPLNNPLREEAQVKKTVFPKFVMKESSDNQNISVHGQGKDLYSSVIPMTVKVEAKAGCPRYLGREIKQVQADATTPTWLKERLRRSGIRSISPIVDVTNYVMLELGQPMHAFDLATIKKGVVVRQSKQGEKIALLDGSEKELDNETLLIADHEKPLAIAGVMGGLDSSVNLLTRDIFLESAYFSPATIARQRQFYNLNSDSAYRFERGVDPTLQSEAIERATQLILEIAGGQAGPVVPVESKDHLPKPVVITLVHEKIAQVLGIDIPDKEVERIFQALQFSYKREKSNWVVQVPAYRFDLTLPEDLIEEIARIHGYDKIPTHNLRAVLRVSQAEDAADDLHVLRLALSNQGFNEIISYSFIDKKLQALLDPREVAREIMNPITGDMTVMRTNLWPGLMTTLLYNKSRQQQRIRLFELGTCFLTRNNEISHQSRLGGLITGLASAEQWGIPSREADFYDLKGNIENILSLSALAKELEFKPDTHPALHPGQTAVLYYGDKKVGIVGALHPAVLQALDLPDKVFAFELDLHLFGKAGLSQFEEISRFPEIRRDIAILVNQAIPAKQIQDTIKDVAGDWLKDVFIFDVYQGKGISTGSKSIALALILQHPTRTLVEDEVSELMERVITALKGQLGAELRS